VRLFPLISILSVCALVSIISLRAGAEDDSTKSISFVREVAPILVSKCQSCHGTKTAESNYRLDSFAAMMQPGDFGTAPITPGDLDNSELHRLITAEDDVERMPNNGSRLADAEIEIITNWIREGARFDGQDAAAPMRGQIPSDVPHPAAPQTYPTTFPVTAMAFNPDGSQLVVGGYHELLVWDSTTASLKARIANMPQRIFGLTFSPDGTSLAIAGGAPGVSGEVRLVPWPAGPMREAASRVFATHDDVFFGVMFRPDGARLAAVGTDGLVRVFETSTGSMRSKINGHADWVTAVSFSADGARIATASRDKTAKVFDAETGSLLSTYSEHNAPVRAVVFSPDGKQVVSAGGNRARIWNVEDSKLVGDFPAFDGEIYALALSGESVFGAAADRSARQFKLSDRSLLRSYAEHPAAVLSLAWHAKSHRIATGCIDGTVTVWNLENGAKELRFVAVPGLVAVTSGP
jgi:WD40 repeat protein